MDEADSLTELCRERVGRLLHGKWTLDALIGVGGMAAVYAATHRNGSRVAIKILHGELRTHGEARERFLREAYIANKVEHPGTVKAHDDGTTEEGEHYIVMELLHGESVETRAQHAGGRLPTEEVLWIAAETLSVLELAHAAGIVHRDLKPENLFLTDAGQLKVLDFGIARLRESATDKRTQTGMMMGTPAFMSPEQAMARWSMVDARTDLWAVGAIMFNLLTARCVHEAATASETLVRAATQPAPSLGRVLPGTPLPLVRLIDRALAFDQGKRFPDAAAMREQVQSLLVGMGGASRGAAVSAATVGAVPAAAVPPAAPSEHETAATHIAGGAEPARPVASASARAAAAAAVRAAVSARPPMNVAASAPPPVRVVASAPPPLRVAVSAPPPLGLAASAPPPVPATLERSAEPETPARAASVAPADVGEPASARQPEAELLGFDAGTLAVAANDDDQHAMQDMFLAIDRALVARRQYDAEHPEAMRRMDRAFSVCASALLQSKDGLFWNVTPYSFVAGGTTLWEPAAPLDQVPYQLFADGVRMLGLLPGLSEGELQELLRIITLDRASEVAPEDDTVTLLWEACFDHVVHQAIDSFEEGDQEQRAKFTRECAQIVALAHFDTSMLVEECWAVRPAHSESLDVQLKKRRLASLLHRSENFDAEAAVQAMELGEGMGGAKAAARDLLRVDEQTMRMLAARLTTDTAAAGPRFVIATAYAYQKAAERGPTGRITAPLRSAIDGLAKHTPDMALELVSQLCRATGQGCEPADAERLRAALAGEIISRDTLEGVLGGACAGGADRDFYLAGLRMILGYLGDKHLPVVLRALREVRDEQILGVVLDYVRHAGTGHEAELGAMFVEADEELGIALVRVLAEIATPEARNAIMRAASSPHAVVRIAALGHVEGASSERLRIELRALLQDRSAEVRLAALRAMQKHNLRGAGPFLVVLVRESNFDAWSAEERQQSLQTVASLAPARGEALCVQILSDSRLIGTPAHDKSREIAASVLGRIATSDEALEILAKTATSRWRASESLRRAAAQALEAARARPEAGAGRGKETGR
jgi:eukaryotic-like serine/threonine-protein kinase